MIPWKHAVRDAAVLAATAALWSRELGGGAPVAVGIGAGLLAGLSGFLVHEWGHLAGALASGSAVDHPESIRSAFLFRFFRGNDRRQFAAMSLGGFAATALVVAVYVAVLPWDTLAGRIALGVTALGVLATIVLELPPFVRVLRGGAIPEGAVYVPVDADG